MYQRFGGSSFGTVRVQAGVNAEIYAGTIAPTCRSLLKATVMELAPEAGQ